MCKCHNCKKKKSYKNGNLEKTVGGDLCLTADLVLPLVFMLNKGILNQLNNWDSK